jgi:hypothetical protein
MESLAIYYDLAKAHALPHSTCSDDEYTISVSFIEVFVVMIFTGWGDIESRKHKSLHKE